MKKKFIPLVILAALSLAACGNSDNSSSANSSSKTSESTIVSSAESKVFTFRRSRNRNNVLSGFWRDNRKRKTLTIFDDEIYKYVYWHGC